MDHGARAASPPLTSLVAATLAAAGVTLAAIPGLALDSRTALRAGPAQGLIPTRDVKDLPAHLEVAAFAAGCFWGVEEAFRRQPGVVATAVGFMGGHTPSPTYRQVCAGDTGHAETVELAFDPDKVSYPELLDLFWNLHDPTTLNRQGPDVGDQYRSVIFTFNDEQRTAALYARDKLQASGDLPGAIVTEILSPGPFTKAEAYHQQYIEKGGIASCRVRHSHNDTPPSRAPPAIQQAP